MSEDRAAYGIGGINLDMPFDEYQAISGINASAIAHGRKSMMHMRHAMTTISKATPAMMFGTLCHSVILEDANPVCCDARRGSKEWQAAIEQAGSERLVCKPDEYEAVCEMRHQVSMKREALWLINSTNHEVSATWKGAYGFAKGRFDGMSADGSILFDYKTTSDIEPRRFFSTAERLAYHVKMGWYAEGIMQIYGKQPKVYIIVQEQKAPYDCFVCVMPPAIVEEGRKEAIEIAMRYRCCEASGVFAGVVDQDLIEYERPAWTLGGDNAEVSMEGVEE